MIYSIFPANRKRLLSPMFVTVIIRDWGNRRGKREYLVYPSREEREQASNWRLNSLYGLSNKRKNELYFINVYPRNLQP
jgi:hypothetical protein